MEITYDDFKKVQFLSDLGFWKGDNNIQILRSFLLGESKDLPEDFSIEGINKTLLLNTLKGLSGQFTKLNNNPALFDAFKLLTPSKQREYCEYIDTAKRETTKQTRLEKIKPMIIQGIGLHDKYKNC